MIPRISHPRLCALLVAVVLVAAIAFTGATAGQAQLPAQPAPAAPSPQEPAPAGQVEPKAVGVPVIVRGREVFRIYGPVGGIMAAERAEGVARRLERIAGDQSIRPRDLGVEHRETSSDFILRGEVVGTVTDDDATLIGRPRREFAEQLLVTLRRAIEDTRATLSILDEHHSSNPGTTVPAGICYDTGHGISAAESRDEANRDFHAWFAAFPDRIHEVHLKNTDSEFVETWHFPHEGGIIDPFEVVKAARDTLTVPELHLFLEVPGKRGRDVGEKRSLEDHLTSIRAVHDALSRAGYRHSSEDHGWTHP
mgnify:CR=1 FL=1